MQIPSHTDQDSFDGLQIADFEHADVLSSSDVSDVITQRLEMRAMEIDEIVYLLTVLSRRKRRTVTSASPVSTVSGNTTLPRTELPPPSRYTGRSRAARPRPVAN